MSEYSGHEKRKYKRLKKPFMIRFKLVGESGQARQDWDMVCNKDICAGGILFNYDKTIDIDSYVKMLINIPISNEPVECIGKIVRIDQKGRIPLLGIAASFTDIKDSDRDKINQLVETFV